MSNIKGKTKLCSVKLGAFNIENVNGSPVYNRYTDYERILTRCFPQHEYDRLLAEPVVDAGKAEIQWFAPPGEEAPATLESLKGTPHYDRYANLRNQALADLRRVAAETGDAGVRAYLESALRFDGTDYMDDVTFCYDGQVTLCTWGMRLLPNRRQGAIVITDGVKDHRTHTVTYRIEGKGEIRGTATSFLRRHGHRLQGPTDIPEIIAAPHYAFERWEPMAPQGKDVTSDLTFTAVCVHDGSCRVTFSAGEGGHLDGALELDRHVGDALAAADFPTPVADEGREFAGWSVDPAGLVLDGDLNITASFRSLPPSPPPPPPTWHVRFETGEQGNFRGPDGKPTNCYEMDVTAGDPIPMGSLPPIKPGKKLQFTGWDADPTAPLTGDTVFHARYEKKPSWWQRMRERGCLKWLLWFLLFLLLLLLLWFLLDNCKGCEGKDNSDDNNEKKEKIDDDVRSTPIDKGDLGKDIDPGNGKAEYHVGVRPIQPGDSIVDNPDGPDYMAGAVNLFFEDENTDLNAFAKDFRRLYPDTKRFQLDYDDYVKRITIYFSPEDRTELEARVERELGQKYKFIMVDEWVVSQSSHSIPGGGSSQSSDNAGWHLRAVNAPQAWQISRGSSDITVAVVDDGCDVNHSMFRGKIVSPYNVYTKSDKVDPIEHGTHVAGLAAGLGGTHEGVSGIAPGCKIMPVQVFNGKGSTLSAEISGIAYAIHQGADVINVSMGPSLKIFSLLPVPVQEQLSHESLKKMEWVWKKVTAMAERKNVVIVFSSGNDQIVSRLNPQNRTGVALCVTAVDPSLRKASFSNFGTGSMIAAPGVDILSSFPGNSYGVFEGTSQAAPIVSGAVALLKSVKPGLTGKQIISILQQSGREVVPGIGPLLQVDRALQLARDGKLPAEAKPTPGAPVEARPGPQPREGNEDEYAAIRREIARYKQKIKELESRLPENQR